MILYLYITTVCSKNTDARHQLNVKTIDVEKQNESQNKLRFMCCSETFKMIVPNGFFSVGSSDPKLIGCRNRL